MVPIDLLKQDSQKPSIYYKKKKNIVLLNKVNYDEMRYTYMLFYKYKGNDAKGNILRNYTFLRVNEHADIMSTS